MIVFYSLRLLLSSTLRYHFENEKRTEEARAWKVSVASKRYGAVVRARRIKPVSFGSRNHSLGSSGSESRWEILLFVGNSSNWTVLTWLYFVLRANFEWCGSCTVFPSFLYWVGRISELTWSFNGRIFYDTHGTVKRFHSSKMRCLGDSALTSRKVAHVLLKFISTDNDVSSSLMAVQNEIYAF